jgi:hypothetical protein
LKQVSAKFPKDFKGKKMSEEINVSDDGKKVLWKKCLKPLIHGGDTWSFIRKLKDNEEEKEGKEEDGKIDLVANTIKLGELTSSCSPGEIKIESMDNKVSSKKLNVFTIKFIITKNKSDKNTRINFTTHFKKVNKYDEEGGKSVDNNIIQPTQVENADKNLNYFKVTREWAVENYDDIELFVTLSSAEEFIEIGDNRMTIINPSSFPDMWLKLNTIGEEKGKGKEKLSSLDVDDSQRDEESPLIPCHKAILAHVSPMFEKRLSGQNTWLTSIDVDVSTDKVEEKKNNKKRKIQGTGQGTGQTTKLDKNLEPTVIMIDGMMTVKEDLEIIDCFLSIIYKSSDNELLEDEQYKKFEQLSSSQRCHLLSMGDKYLVPMVCKWVASSIVHIYKFENVNLCELYYTAEKISEQTSRDYLFRNIYLHLLDHPCRMLEDMMKLEK